MLETILTIGQAVVALLLGVIGFLISIHPLDTFAALGILGIGLTIWQAVLVRTENASRDQREMAQRLEIMRISGKMEALTTIVGPAAREDARRIAESLASLTITKPGLNTSSIETKTVRHANISDKDRALSLVAEILACLAERNSAEPIPAIGTPEFQEVQDQQIKYIAETNSICAKRLGVQIVRLHQDLKKRGINDTDLDSEIEMFPRSPNFREIARRLEFIAKSLR